CLSTLRNVRPNKKRHLRRSSLRAPTSARFPKTLWLTSGAVSQSEALSATRPARILVAEDEELILAVFQAILKKAGFEVVCASNGVQAASLFDEGKDRFDLLITDLSLPGLDGEALAEHVRKSRPDIGIIFSTGSITNAPQQAADKYKALFLPKPFGFEELVTIVNKAIQK